MEMSFPLHNEQIASEVNPCPCQSQGVKQREECCPPQQREISVNVSFINVFSCCEVFFRSF